MKDNDSEEEILGAIKTLDVLDIHERRWTTSPASSSTSPFDNFRASSMGLNAYVEGSSGNVGRNSAYPCDPGTPFGEFVGASSRVGGESSDEEVCSSDDQSLADDGPTMEVTASKDGKRYRITADGVLDDVGVSADHVVVARHEEVLRKRSEDLRQQYAHGDWSLKRPRVQR